jgi:hypothetical protein
MTRFFLVIERIRRSRYALISPFHVVSKLTSYELVFYKKAGLHEVSPWGPVKSTSALANPTASSNPPFVCPHILPWLKFTLALFGLALLGLI